MENGSTDRRRSTVSRARPNAGYQNAGHQNAAIDEGVIREISSETMKFPWSSQSASSPPASPVSPAKPPGHKRSVSGSLLARLNFLGGGKDGRPSSSDGNAQPLQSPKSATSTKSRKSIDDDNNDEAAVSPVSPVKGESAMAAALRPAKTRKRKGSLRKTALLGGRRLVPEGRERRNSLLQRSPTAKQAPLPTFNAPTQPISASEQLFSGGVAQPHFPSTNESSSDLPDTFNYENTRASYSSDNGWPETAAAVTPARLALLTESAAYQDQRKASADLTSPVELSRQTSYASTTDDDDILTFDRPANGYAAQQREPLSLKKPLSSAATSYFPSVPTPSDSSLSRRVSSKHRSSPLSHNITNLSSYPEPEPHDYTETEYWGWVILFVTWLTFTVGMGSCLEIWSWAWDVGETPRAPPELEDDPTLPIVGYYPALMVLTGVVAWIWITIAWLGMKYFRHAKIEV